MSQRPQVAILYNPEKPDAQATTDTVRQFVASMADVVGSGPVDEVSDYIDKNIDRIIVLGGDGSILHAARKLNAHQVPIIGVNFGKLGYLTEYSVDELKTNLDKALNDPSAVSKRMMIEAAIMQDDHCCHRSLAVNDCVVNAGAPFRMISLSISVNGDHLTNVNGDGLVLATPTGSTAHNMSVGGPIVQPTTQAIIISPISAHSLTHRPIVVNSESTIEVTTVKVNEGTRVVIDGQEDYALHAGDRLIVRPATQHFLMVRNPAKSAWYTLTRKLRWGQSTPPTS